MKNWRTGSGGLAIVLALFASGCIGNDKVAVALPDGPGTGDLGSDGSVLGTTNPRCNVVGLCERAAIYNDGSQLYISNSDLTTRLNIKATADAAAYGGVVPGVAVTANNGFVRRWDQSSGNQNQIDRPTGFRSSQSDALRNGLQLQFGDAPFSLADEDIAYGYWHEVYSHLQDYSIFPTAYSYYVRTQDPAIDKNSATGQFSVIRTARDDEYLVIGTALSLKYEARVLTTRFSGGGAATLFRYKPVESGGFVSGPEFKPGILELPPTGHAAYIGFAQAYAQSSNLNFLPFSPNDNSFASSYRDPSYFVSGRSAMVFSFDDGGASFEHGYISLAGQSYERWDSDFVNDLTRPQARLFPFGLDNRFANPEYLSPEHSVSRASVDITTYQPNPDSYVENTGGYHDIGRSRHTRTNDRYWSGLAFRLMPLDSTDNKMDFSVELVSVGADFRSGHAAHCSPGSGSDVVCYASTRDDGGPGGVGYTEFFGSRGSNTKVNQTYQGRAPNLAGGVWQYDGIVFVDTMGTPDEADDELLGIVDLFGSIGGIVYDAQPCGAVDGNNVPIPGTEC